MFRNLFKKKTKDFVAPMSGKIIDITEVKDPVFSSKAMGEGFAIEFDKGNVFAPVKGEIIMVFKTLHALGIRSEEGDEYLIHIGLETVNLDGEGFEAHVAVGDKVQKNDLLISVDHQVLDQHKIDKTSPIIITNASSPVKIVTSQDYVTAGQEEIIHF